MHLEGNPHRKVAVDHDGDIGIDPVISLGDRVRYLRLDGSCGIWTNEGCETGLQVAEALARVLSRRPVFRNIERLTAQITTPALLRRLEVETGVPGTHELSGRGTTDPHVANTEASLFLSYSSKDVLLAREVYGDLIREAHAEVWFDLSRPGESPDHEASVEEWLRQAIFDARGLVLLLTRAAQGSPWVLKELNWAKDKLQADPSFHLVLLKLADVELPELPPTATVIDVQGLEQGNGLNEELYGVLFERTARRQWNRQLRESLWWPQSDDVEATFTYDDFWSDSGEVFKFEWTNDESLQWQLEYGSGDERREIRGSGEDAPIDLNLKPGQLVGGFVCRRRKGLHFHDGVKLWMRSDDLSLKPDDVMDNYYSEMGPYPLAGTPTISVMKGSDAFRRTLVDFKVQTASGEPISYAKAFRITCMQNTASPQRQLEAAEVADLMSELRKQDG